MRWPDGRPAAGVTRPRPAPGPGAAELTPDSEARATRFAAAAQAAWFAAQPVRARSLAEAALVDAADPLRRADLDRLRARIEWNMNSPLVAQRILLAAADEVVGIDVERARAMTLLAVAVASFTPEGAEPLNPPACRAG